MNNISLPKEYYNIQKGYYVLSKKDIQLKNTLINLYDDLVQNLKNIHSTRDIEFIYKVDECCGDPHITIHMWNKFFHSRDNIQDYSDVILRVLLRHKPKISDLMCDSIIPILLPFVINVKKLFFKMIHEENISIVVDDFYIATKYYLPKNLRDENGLFNKIDVFLCEKKLISNFKKLEQSEE